MITVVKHCLRGTRTLPFVGPHPGNAWLVIIYAAVAVTGLSFDDPVRGVLSGLAAVTVVFVPMYLYGAYERSRLSARLRRD